MSWTTIGRLLVSPEKDRLLRQERKLVPQSDDQGFAWYRLLLKLYPKTYRQEYEEEMLNTLREMFGEAKTSVHRWQLMIRVIKDYLLSLSQESLYATENSFSRAPRNVKREFAISASLVAPFFIVFAYNVTSFAFRHAIALGNLEVHTWVVYTIVLPLMGFLLSVKTCLSGIYGQLLRREWRQVVSTIFRDWLFLGVAVGTLAVIAIF